MKLGMTKKKWGLASLLALVISGGSLVMSGQQGISRVASAIADPMSILADRSPGARGAGALTQTKPSRVAPAKQVADNDPRPFTPIERVLSNVRSRPPVGATPGEGPAVGVAPVPTGPMAAAVTPGGNGAGPRGGPIGGPTISPIGGGGGSSSSGGGGGGGGGIVCPPGSTAPGCTNTDPCPPGSTLPGCTNTTPCPPGSTLPGCTTTPPGCPPGSLDPGCTVPPPPPPPPTGGVPEPATWAMLVAGFLGIGALLRRRRRTAVVVVADPH